MEQVQIQAARDNTNATHTVLTSRAAGNQEPLEVIGLDASGAVAGGASATQPGVTMFRDTAVTNTAVAVKATSGRVYMLHIENPAAAKSYVHFYDLAAASVVVGTTVPKWTVMIPTLATYDVAFAYPLAFATAIAVAATTTATGNTAPSAALLVNAGYA